MVLTPEQAARLAPIRARLGGSPAPAARPVEPVPLDSRPRFGNWASKGLRGRLVNRRERADEELGPLLEHLNSDDPLIAAQVREHEEEIAWLLLRRAEEEKAAAPVQQADDGRAAIESLGLTIPEGVPVGAFYEQNRETIIALSNAAEMRGRSDELATAADAIAAGVAAKQSE